MKKYIFIFLLLSTVVSLSQTRSEFRATWLTNVDSYVLYTDESIIEAMDYLASIGINVVFPVVYNKGYTLYPSDVMKEYFDIEVIPEYAFQQRDFLERLVIEAHRNGIEVIPWFEFGFATSYSQNGGHIIDAYPEWALKDRDGNLVVKNGFDWMSGINPDVQEFMLKLMKEVVTKYDVDGVQGDDRLPAMPSYGGYDDATVAVYKAEHDGSEPPYNYNDANWMQWRAQKLTQFLADLRDTIKNVNEHLIISSSPTPYPWGYQNYLQHSRNWVAAGIVDNVIPQLYRYDISSYRATLNESLQYVGNLNKEIYAAGVLAKSGSWVITPDYLLQAVQENRNREVNGECFFFYEALRKNDDRLGDTLKATYYNEPALVPYRNGEIYRPKALILNEDEPNVTSTGSWATFQMKGYEGGILYTQQANDDASISYEFDVPFDAYFDVFIYSVPNTPWTTQAHYTVQNENGESIEIVYDQHDTKKKGWQKIATSYFTQGMKKVVTLDNRLMQEGEYLVADAMMIMINRQYSPDVVVSVEENNIDRITPNEFALKQNYPNPFNSQTNITFSLTEAAFISLDVYSVLGEKIRTIASGNFSQGFHTVRFDADGLASGIYYYKLTANNASLSKKMIYIK